MNREFGASGRSPPLRLRLYQSIGIPLLEISFPHGRNSRMTISRFSTETYAADLRWPAWTDALRQLPIDGVELLGDGPPYGSLVARTAEDGSQCAVLRGCRQAIDLFGGAAAGGLWALHVTEGRGHVKGLPQAVGAGATLHGSTRIRHRLSFATEFELVLLHLPRLPLRASSGRPEHLAGVLMPRSAVGEVAEAMLTSLGRGLGNLSQEQFGRLSKSLSEVLADSLTFAGAGIGIGGKEGYWEAIHHRLCRSIEARLDEPDLTLEKIAAQSGLSGRMATKAFHHTGTSFSSYIRSRRLAGASGDLRASALADLPIGTIAARWGFPDQARFSRLFREHFGVPPSAWRQAAPTGLPDRTATHRGAPRPPARMTLICDDTSGAPELVTDVADHSQRHYLTATAKTVHWGYFSRHIPPVLTVLPGAVIVVETLTHHAYDDHARMIEADPGAESVFGWTAQKKNVDRRGAGPMDASVLGRGAGEGFGVHVCTGPIAVTGAAPGDVLEIRILDIAHRPSRSAAFAGRSFGSNAATWWGYHYRELLTEPRPREVVTIFEMSRCQGGACAHGVYSFRWTPQTDPSGIVHPTYDYPGVPIDRATIEERHGVLAGIHIPVRPHFGVIALAPNHDALVDSVPPSYFGGNIDNWRLGAGASVFLPVAVAGALLSIGDPHASQGDAELCGTAIECSLTGTFELVLHKRRDLQAHLADLNYPLIETPEEWVIQGFSHPNHLAEFGEKAQTEVYKTSSLDLAMQDTFRKARRFLMIRYGLSEDEAICLLSVAVDFGVTQVVDGNWGMHACIRKSLCEGNLSNRPIWKPKLPQ